MAGDDQQVTPQSPEKQEITSETSLTRNSLHTRATTAAQRRDRRCRRHRRRPWRYRRRVVPITPPMAGPADLVGEQMRMPRGTKPATRKSARKLIDPRDELTPG